MGNCCGGKNAGKPISWPRFLLGLGVFAGYHGTVAAGLAVASLVRRELGPVRDFHRQLFTSELGEILRMHDLHVGRAGHERWQRAQAEARCRVDG